MFNQWKVPHLDQVESENLRFCRPQAHEHFTGHCESVQTFDEGEVYLERTFYTSQSFSCHEGVTKLIIRLGTDEDLKKLNCTLREAMPDAVIG